MDTETMRPNIDITNQTDGAIEDLAEARDTDKGDVYQELLDHSLSFQPLDERAREALVDYLSQEQFNGQEREQAEHLVETAHTTMVAGYKSDSPGYVGDFIFAIYGYPQTYALYAYEDGEVQKEINREAQK